MEGTENWFLRNKYKYWAEVEKLKNSEAVEGWSSTEEKRNYTQDQQYNGRLEQVFSKPINAKKSSFHDQRLVARMAFSEGLQIFAMVHHNEN